jgi:hypothetical protein
LKPIIWIKRRDYWIFEMIMGENRWLRIAWNYKSMGQRGRAMRCSKED